MITLMRSQSFRQTPVWLLMLSLLMVGACGGGRDNRLPDPPPPVTTAPQPAFGLTTREPMASLNIPLAGGTIGSYVLEEAFPGLNFPAAIFLTAVPGTNRLLVVQQSGYGRAFVDSATSNDSDLILDLSAQVTFSGEQGLLGLALDPAFESNRFIYLHYSIGSPRRSRIARFRWDAGTDRVALSSEKVLLDVAQPYSNHNAGMLAFGPDDYLYIAFGDGGSGGDPENHAQDPSDPLGSLLRIDVHPADPLDDYDIPMDNPFLGQSGFLPETYAYGLRNPFRFSFDRGTGTLWLGDVGQSAREEVDIIEAGNNYGWRVFEGNLAYDDSLNTLPNSAFTAPVIDYGRSQGTTVIGGYVYRGSRVASLQGRYLYADYGSGNVWALTYDSVTRTVLDNDLIASLGGITSFAEDAAGDVKLVTGAGTIYQFQDVGSGTPTDPPPLLSQTGVFEDLTTLTTASGFIEYQPIQPFWSDGAEKRRWIAIPDAAQIGFEPLDAWQFPVGTVMVKHFELALREGDSNSLQRLETRLLIRRGDGWRGFTYRWRADESEADLLAGREQQTLTVELAAGGTRDQLYEYPSRTDCLGCHTEAAGVVLGIRTRQMNRSFAYPAATDNQLRSWNNIGLFDTDIGSADSYEAYSAASDGSAPLGDRARVYLDVNCAHCHQPLGPAPSVMDLRFDTALADSGLLDTLPAAGDLGVADARIVAPGDRTRSVLWLRMERLDDNRMPTIGSHVVDSAGLSLVGDWIDGL